MNPRGFAVVLPARYDSKRFPGKPLALILGRPLIEWVYSGAERIRGAACVIVATDSRRIANTVTEFGGKAILTSADHRTGTDRIAEVARNLDYEFIVNLQGDEPIFPSGLVEEMVSKFESNPDISIVTACHSIRHREDIENPNNVKVVMDSNGRALYFSRSPIPYISRNNSITVDSRSFYRHIGIYAFRRASLLEFASFPQTPLEIKEGLEQLRALENGMEIQLVVSSKPTLGVDIPSDIKIVEKALAGHYTDTLEKHDAVCGDQSSEL